MVLLVSCKKISANSENESEWDFYELEVGDPPSLYALAWNGDFDRIKKILKEHPDWVDQRGLYGRTCLMATIYRRNAGMVKYFLEKGADPNLQDDSGYTSLYKAVDESHEKIVRLLLEYGADPNIKTRFSNGSTPLYWAAYKGDLPIVRLLMDAGAVQTEEHSPLLGATMGDNWDIFMYLIENGGSTENWNEIFREAVYRNQLDIVRYVLDNADIDINFRPDFYSKHAPLEIALSNKNEEDEERNFEMIRFLLSRGACLEDVGEGNVMLWAMEYSNDSTFDYLLQEGFRFNGLNTKSGRPYLALALDMLSFHAACYLLEQEEGEPEFKGKPMILYFADGYTPTTPIIEFLMQKGVNREHWDKAFLQCIQYGDLDAAISMLARGVSINAKDENGLNALYYTTDPDIAEYLIGRGIDVFDPVTCDHLNENIPVLSTYVKWGIPLKMPQDTLNKVLRLAAGEGDARLVEYLLNKGADVHAREPLPVKRNRYYVYPQRTPLLENAWKGYRECSYDPERMLSPEVGRLLITAGASVNAKDGEGKTALEYILSGYRCYCGIGPIPLGNREERDHGFHGDPASPPMQNHMCLAVELLENGADINWTDREGNSPLMLAINRKYDQIVPLLIKVGADVNHRNKWGYTPLLFAAQYNLQIVIALVEAGADIEMKNREGNTSLILATKAGKKDIVEYLLSAGADIEACNKKGETMMDYVGVYELFLLMKEKGYADRISPEKINSIYQNYIHECRYSFVLDTLVLEDLITHGLDITTSIVFSNENIFHYLNKNCFTPEIISALCRWGVSVNEKDQWGRTILENAVKDNWPLKCIEVLLQHNADPYQQNNQGLSAMEYARQSGNRDIIQLFKTSPLSIP